MKAIFTYSLFIVLGVATLILFIIDLMVGSTTLSGGDVWNVIIGNDSTDINRQIVINIRLNKAVVAFISGAALSVSGLQMQTLFRNPLAGPYVLGISSGASLGVAVFLLGIPLFGVSPWISPLGIAGAAWIGALLLLFFIGLVSQKVKDIMVILILGMMFSSGISAIVQILQYLSHDESLKSFVIWTMGSLGDVTGDQLIILASAVTLGLILAVATVKPLNQLLLGEEYARTMGLNIRKSRALLFISTTLLAGTITAFCGPIGFIGLAVPHVARMTFKNSDHRILLPATLIIGGLIMIFCDLVSKIFILPINAITALLGIPVIIYIIFRVRSISI